MARRRGRVDAAVKKRCDRALAPPPRAGRLTSVAYSSPEQGVGGGGGVYSAAKARAAASSSSTGSGGPFVYELAYRRDPAGLVESESSALRSPDPDTPPTTNVFDSDMTTTSSAFAPDETQSSKSYGYDPNDRLLSQGSAFGAITYAYDPADNATNQTSPRESRDFAYDAAHQLSSVTRRQGSGTETERLSYDQSANRTEGPGAGEEHPHGLKKGKRYSDLFKDRQGNVYEKPRDGSGSGEPLGINLNDLPW